MLAKTEASSPQHRRALRSPVAWFTLLLVFTAGLSADLISKDWSFRTAANQPIELDRQMLLSNPGYDPIGYQPSRPVLPGGLLNIKLVLNPGAVFGIGASQRWFFIVFTIVALSVGLVVFSRYTTGRSHLAHVALGLILAGGVGNLYDRIVFGRVRDFIHMLSGHRLPFGWEWPGTSNPELFPWVFNIADVLLLVGMLILMIHINRLERSRKQAEAAAELADEEESAALATESVRADG